MEYLVPCRDVLGGVITADDGAELRTVAYSLLPIATKSSYEMASKVR